MTTTCLAQRQRAGDIFPPTCILPYGHKGQHEADRRWFSFTSPGVRDTGPVERW